MAMPRAACKGASWGMAVMLLLAVLFAAPGQGAAAGQSPAAFLHAIYGHYIGDPAKALGLPLDTHAKIRRYFEPSLAALIIKDQDAAARRGETPVLDGDPFVDAQDWRIAAVDIRVQNADDGKATGVVSFQNGGKPMTVTLQLVKLQGVWKIGDIVWADEGSLRGLYNAPPK
jgi:hypothetical protein